MATLQTLGIVLANRNLTSRYFLLEIYCPPIAMKIKPGQFMMLRVSNSHFPLLRRPFSIYKSYPKSHPEKEKRGRLLILYQKVGKGTKKMTEFQNGEKLDMIGPLGNGFCLPSPSSKANIVLIGGGVGIVTLYPLAEKIRGGKLAVLIGGKTREDILCAEDFKKLGSTLSIATEDGSLGTKGTVVDLFLSSYKNWNKNEPTYFYACGPFSMLRTLAERFPSKDHFFQASLESRMACGFGACWGCVVKTRDSKTPYQRVCKEGPVFNLKDILWESR